MESLFKFSLTGSVFYLTPFLLPPAPRALQRGRKMSPPSTFNWFSGFFGNIVGDVLPGVSRARAHSHSHAHTLVDADRDEFGRIHPLNGKKRMTLELLWTLIRLIDLAHSIKNVGGRKKKKKRSGYFHLSLLSLSKQLPKLMVISCSACQLEWNWSQRWHQICLELLFLNFF